MKRAVILCHAGGKPANRRRRNGVHGRLTSESSFSLFSLFPRGAFLSLLQEQAADGDGEKRQFWICNRCWRQPFDTEHVARDALTPQGASESSAAGRPFTRYRDDSLEEGICGKFAVAPYPLPAQNTSTLLCLFFDFPPTSVWPL